MFKSTILIVGLMLSSIAWGSGFEKTNLISGRYMGIAGAATSSVAGSEALYFNPAGLGGGKNTNEIVGDLSFMQINFNAPVTANDQSSLSSRLAAAPGFFYRRIISDNLALGIGYYAAGGNNAEFSGVQFQTSGGTNYSLKPDVYTKISIEELAVGLGYKVNEKWRVGLAWRGGMAQADQSAGVNTGTALVNHQYRGLKGSNMMGYRVGVQYDFDENCGFGIMYRNALPVALNGKFFYQGEIPALSNSFSSNETDMSVKTQLPAQLAFGAHHRFNENWKGFFDYSWTNYGAVDRLIYEGTASAPGALAAQLQTQTLADVFVGWSDKHVVRLAGEYTNGGMPIRFGYTYATQVTSTNYANATYAPPAPSHTLSLGSGWDVDDAWVINGAVDYTNFSGSVASNQVLNSVTKAGSYTADVYALHLGATYDF